MVIIKHEICQILLELFTGVRTAHEVSNQDGEVGTLFRNVEFLSYMVT